MTWLLIVLTVLAVARFTRLVTDDDITSPFRQWVVRRTGPDSKWTTLSTCPWCVSVYVATVAATVVVLWPDNRAVWAVLIAATASLVTGLLGKVW